jgi:hypothetical protein
VSEMSEKVAFMGHGPLNAWDTCPVFGTRWGHMFGTCPVNSTLDKHVSDTCLARVLWIGHVTNTCSARILILSCPTHMIRDTGVLEVSGDLA